MLIIYSVLCVLLLVYSVIFWRVALIPFKKETRREKTSFINIKGDYIYYEIHGKTDGIPILLIHGTSADHSSWRLLLPHLENDYKLIVVNIPGLGMNPLFPRRKDYTLDNISSKIIAFLDAIKEKKVYCVGASLGGSIALWLYAKYPQYFMGNITSAPANYKHNIKILAVLANILQFSGVGYIINFIVMFMGLPILFGMLQILEFFKVNRISSRRTIEAYKILLMDTYLQFIEAPNQFAQKISLVAHLLKDPYLPYITSKIQKPFTVIWGERDLVISRKSIMPFHNFPLHLQFHEIKNAVHTIPTFSPKVFAKYIRNTIENQGKLPKL